MDKSDINLGDKVTMTGFTDPSNVFYGIVGEVVDMRWFQSASSDDLYLSALVEFTDTFGGVTEYESMWYPISYLSKAHDERRKK